MAYEKTVWVNGQAPALDAEKLNHMEDGIANADTAAANATTTAQAAATVANNALEVAQKAGLTAITAFSGPISTGSAINLTTPIPDDAKLIVLTVDNIGASMCSNKIGTFSTAAFIPEKNNTSRMQVFAHHFNVTKTTVEMISAGQYRYNTGEWSDYVVNAGDITITVYK